MVLVSNDEDDDELDDRVNSNQKLTTVRSSAPNVVQRPNGDINNVSNQIPSSSADVGLVSASAAMSASASAAGQHISTSQWLQKIQNEERLQYHYHNHQPTAADAPPIRKKEGSARDKKKVKSLLRDEERAVDVVRPPPKENNNNPTPNMNGGNDSSAVGKFSADEALLSRHPLTLSDLKRLRAEERQTKPPTNCSTTSANCNNQQQNSSVQNAAPPKNNNNSSNVSAKFSAADNTVADGPTARYRAPSDTVIGSPPTLRSRNKLGGLKCCSIS